MSLLQVKQHISKLDNADMSPEGDNNISEISSVYTSTEQTSQSDEGSGSGGAGQSDQRSPEDPPEDVPEVFLSPQEQAYYALSKQHEESLSSVEKLQAMLHSERLKNVQLESQLAKGLFIIHSRRDRHSIAFNQLSGQSGQKS